MKVERTQIRIVDEAVLTVSPAVGESYRQVALTYQMAPRPPNVVFIREDDLPDLVWRRDHPKEKEAPPQIQAQGDKVRRERILAHAGRPTPQRGRALP